MFLPLLLIAFIVIPIVELLLILQVAEWLGGGATGAALTILLLIGDSLLGAWLMRSQGRSVWRQFVAATERGRMPAREIMDGGFVIAGGVLLLTPGFLSDIVGVAMLLPPTRKLFGGLVFNMIARRFTPFRKIADSGLRDFPRSSQPPRPGSSEPTAEPIEQKPLPSGRRDRGEAEFNFEKRTDDEL